jgi:hypothetical protein
MLGMTGDVEGENSPTDGKNGLEIYKVTEESKNNKYI